MSGSLQFNVPNMNTEDAKLGMRQASRDLRDGLLPEKGLWDWYPSRINRCSDSVLKTAAFMRGYLLIVLRKGRLCRNDADQVAKLLMREHYLIDWFPESWWSEALAKFPKANDLVRAALRYQIGQ